MGKDIFKLTIPGKPDCISVARLTSSAIANKIGLSLEEIEDIKVALSEACTNALKRADEINIQFVIDDEKFTMIVENALLPIESDDISTKELEMGILIMKSLMDEVKFYNEGVELIKHMKDGNKNEHKLSI